MITGFTRYILLDCDMAKYRQPIDELAKNLRESNLGNPAGAPEIPNLRRECNMVRQLLIRQNRRVTNKGGDT